VSLAIYNRSSLFSFRLPQWCFSGLNLSTNVTIKRRHERDPRQHRVAPAAAQHQRFDSDLPLRQFDCSFGKPVM
jgi:hypothetical protein